MYLQRWLYSTLSLYLLQGEKVPAGCKGFYTGEGGHKHYDQQSPRLNLHKVGKASPPSPRSAESGTEGSPGQ